MDIISGARELLPIDARGEHGPWYLLLEYMFDSPCSAEILSDSTVLELRRGLSMIVQGVNEEGEPSQELKDAGK